MIITKYWSPPVTHLVDEARAGMRTLCGTTIGRDWECGEEEEPRHAISCCARCNKSAAALARKLAATPKPEVGS